MPCGFEPVRHQSAHDLPFVGSVDGHHINVVAVGAWKVRRMPELCVAVRLHQGSFQIERLRKKKAPDSCRIRK
jgi:hypothetical protein